MTTDEHTTSHPMPIGVGMPAWLLLHEFGRMVYQAFGHYAMLVGSALESRQPRDIDVRLTISDKQFHDLFRLYTLNQAGGIRPVAARGERWVQER